MKTRALTVRQQRYAEKRHNLIYAFLKAKRLSVDEFYDVVVFGYLRAVRNYFKRPELRRFKFSTIAWWCMRTEISNYYRKQRRESQFIAPVSLDTAVYDDGSSRLIDRMPNLDPLADELESIFIRHELASRVTKRQLAMLNMRVAGYSDREIARAGKTTINEVNEQFSRVRNATCSLFLEV